MQEFPSGESVHLQAVWDTTVCPECGGLAEVQWRAVLESSDGPVEHEKIMCVGRHWFLLPVARFAGGARAQAEGGMRESSRIGSPEGDPSGA
jgi:hypothetical protein